MEEPFGGVREREKCLWGIYKFPLLFLWLFISLAVLDDYYAGGLLKRGEEEAGVCSNHLSTCFLPRSFASAMETLISVG